MLEKQLKKIKRFKDSLISNGKRITFVSIIVVPIIMFALLEIIQRGSPIDAFLWLIKYPLNATIYFIFIAAVNLILIVISNRLYISTIIITAVCVPIAVISYNKMIIRELPLMPWNMTLIKELVTTISLVKELVWIFIVTFIIAMAILAFISYLFVGIKSGLSTKVRIIIMCISIIVMFSAMKFFTLSTNSLETVDIYSQRGVVPSLIYYANKPYMQKPENYSKQAVLKALNSVENKIEIKNDEELPDIIMVMGEAFWDVTKLKNVEFSKDPLSNLHRLADNSIRGQLLINSYGGNTTNTEYEVLSGMNMSFIPPDSPAYTDFYKGQFPALPYFLKKLNYKAEAIHPFYGDFLNRANAFKLMGFEKFYTKDSFVDAKRIGDYISDYSAWQKIIELYEKNKKTDPKTTYFSFTTTIQNHYNFDPRQYLESSDITMQIPDSVKDSDAKMLRGYVYGVEDTDALLGRLTDYFSDEKRKVIVVFFGDHLPALGKDFEFYKKAGLIDDATSGKISEADRRLLHEVPFIIWSNFADKTEDKGTVSASYLQEILFDEYNIPMNNFQKFLFDVLKVKKDFGLSAWPQTNEGIFTQTETDYRMIQYDLLFGEGYAMEEALK